MAQSKHPSDIEPAADLGGEVRALRRPLVRLYNLLQISACVAVLYLLAQSGGAVLMVLCASLLVAVVLHDIAGLFVRYARVPEWMALVAVLGVLVAGALLLAWTTGAELVYQLGSLQEALKSQLHEIHTQMNLAPLGRIILDHVPVSFGGNEADRVGSGADFTNSMTNIVSSTFGSVGTCAVIFVAGIYFAADPRLYANGLLRLVPDSHKISVRQMMLVSIKTLSLWVRGQALDMAVVGVSTGVSLWAIGLPLALPLGIIAGLANFIPYLGAFFGVIPALLLSLSHGGHETMVVVVTLYAAIQFFEGYVMSPFIQRRVVQMPPALTILSQTVLGALLGGTGFIFAAPITAVLLAITSKLTDRLRQDVAF